MAMTEGACKVVQPISGGQLTSTNWLRPREDPRSKCFRWSVLNVFSCGARHISWVF